MHILPKKRYCKKHHLFNKSNKQSMYILHYHTFLQVVHSIFGRNKLLSLFFLKLRFQNKLVYFLKNSYFKNPICLINRINKVCNFIHNNTFLYIAPYGFIFPKMSPYLKKEQNILGTFHILGIMFHSLLEIGRTLDHSKGLANILVTKN